MKNLLLTLGHNSSAILVEDDKIVWGYETERFTKVKSDSRFPAEVLAHFSLSCADPDMVYVSHWNPHGMLGRMSAKHWMPEYVDGRPIRTYDPDFTHHDGHAYAAINFADPDPFNKWHVLVVDGFGNYGEHLSLYEVEHAYGIEHVVPKPKLLTRFRGYNTSLGLMYQYATAFVGMKMNEDEYKFLGYEARIRQHLSADQLEALDLRVAVAVAMWVEATSLPAMYSVDDPVFNLNALEEVKATRFREFSKVLDAFGGLDPTSTWGRSVIGYYVQKVLEECVMAVLQFEDVENLVVTGGCFMNVKLNNRLLKHVKGVFAPHPLCGDQGNALGMYARDNPSFKFPRDLFWGRRNLYLHGEVEGIEMIRVEEELMAKASMELRLEGIVNVVRGDMEFGPRALCNTSTLAVPTYENVERINRYNARNTIMPMAPVVTDTFFRANFKGWYNLAGSERFMICALDYRSMLREWSGASNEYDVPERYFTGRPQVIYKHDDPLLYGLVDSFGGILINTSFNFHGQPICYDMMDVVNTHRLNRKHGSTVQTLVLEK